MSSVTAAPAPFRRTAVELAAEQQMQQVKVKPQPQVQTMGGGNNLPPAVRTLVGGSFFDENKARGNVPPMP